MPVHFFLDGVDFKIQKRREKIRWINAVVKNENRKTAQVNFIFTSDEKLLVLNSEYLNHRTLTDIITFDYSDMNSISGDIYISIDRIKENATKFCNSFDEELNRVIIHGILHLCGYCDKTKSEKSIMRKKEDDSLFLLNVSRETFK